MSAKVCDRSLKENQNACHADEKYEKIMNGEEMVKNV